MDDVQIARILEKLAGAKLTLNASLPEDAVSSFEAAHGVTLPDGYRRFLTQAGNGGAGPFHGLLPLEQWDYAFSREPEDLPRDHLARSSHFVPGGERGASCAARRRHLRRVARWMASRATMSP